MKKIAVNTKNLPMENGTDLSIKYYIVVEEMPEFNESGSFEMYGVCIEAGKDSACVLGITSSQCTIEKIVDLLSSNAVTPSHLEDVILDQVGLLM